MKGTFKKAFALALISTAFVVSASENTPITLAEQARMYVNGAFNNVKDVAIATQATAANLAQAASKVTVNDVTSLAQNTGSNILGGFRQFGGYVQSLVPASKPAWMTLPKVSMPAWVKELSLPQVDVKELAETGVAFVKNNPVQAATIGALVATGSFITYKLGKAVKNYFTKPVLQPKAE